MYRADTTPDIAKVRTGRAALHHLKRAAELRVLTDADAKRWCAQMEAAFDAVLGPPTPPPPPDPVFGVIRGGRP